MVSRENKEKRITHQSCSLGYMNIYLVPSDPFLWDNAYTEHVRIRSRRRNGFDYEKQRLRRQLNGREHRPSAVEAEYIMRVDPSMNAERVGDDGMGLPHNRSHLLSPSIRRISCRLLPSRIPCWLSRSCSRLYRCSP